MSGRTRTWRPHGNKVHAGGTGLAVKHPERNCSGPWPDQGLQEGASPATPLLRPSAAAHLPPKAGEGQTLLEACSTSQPLCSAPCLPPRGPQTAKCSIHLHELPLCGLSPAPWPGIPPPAPPGCTLAPFSASTQALPWWEALRVTRPEATGRRLCASAGPRREEEASSHHRDRE